MRRCRRLGGCRFDLPPVCLGIVRFYDANPPQSPLLCYQELFNKIHEGMALHKLPIPRLGRRSTEQ